MRVAGNAGTHGPTPIVLRGSEGAGFRVSGARHSGWAQLLAY